MTVRVHWLRHGHIASHRGDTPLTDEGVSQSRERGEVLASEIEAGETIHFLHAPTLRTRQTVEEIRSSIENNLTVEASLMPVREEWAIRNPDIYVAGQRVEMVSSAEALSEQLTSPPVAPDDLEHHPFFEKFFVSPDRIGYWVALDNPPGEDAAAVARRQLTYARSLADAPQDGLARYVLSTHSPVLRAILVECFGDDPGEPGYLEPVDLLIEGPGVQISFRGESRLV